MKIALIVSLLVTSLALNAQTLQGKVVRVDDRGLPMAQYVNFTRF